MRIDKPHNLIMYIRQFLPCKVYRARDCLFRVKNISIVFFHKF